MTQRPLPEHDGYAELAAGWALHALEPDDETRFADHLASCSDCQRAVADYAGALAEVSSLSPTVEPPASLGERIRAEVARDLESASEPRSPLPSEPAPLPEPVPLADRRPAAPARTRRWLLAAAAAVVLVLAVGNVVQYQRTRAAEQRADRQSVALSREHQEAARRAELLRLIGQPGARVSQLTADGRIMAYVLVHDKTVQIVTDGMAPNDPSQEFVLWMVGDGGNPKAMFKFDVARSDIDLARLGQLPSVQGGIKAFAVSIEPRQAGMPTTPTHKLADGKAVT
jgi:hypothetical protein